MNGPEGAALLLRDRIAERLPARLRLLETRLGLEANTLPDPARVLAAETGPLALEDWPSVYVLPQRTTGLALVDVHAGADEAYRITYALRLVGWLRGDTYAGTDTLRKRYALALREVLLERKGLRGLDEYAAGTYGAGEYGGDDDPIETVIRPETIREGYSEVFTDDAKRTIAGVVVDLELDVTETLPAPTPYGDPDEPNTIDVTVALDGDTASIPPHPAL